MTRPRFSVRTLLIAVSVLALVAWSGTVVYREQSFKAALGEYESARTDYYEKWIGYGAGTTSARDVCAASGRLSDKECALAPAPKSQVDALYAHIERLRLLSDKINVPPDFSTSVDQAQLDLVQQNINQANERLRQLQELRSGSNN
jgi:hypothetical protein